MKFEVVTAVKVYMLIFWAVPNPRFWLIYPPVPWAYHSTFPVVYEVLFTDLDYYTLKMEAVGSSET